MSGPKKDYEVGKGKPPKATQFEPGQPGNPKARPKGRRNLKTDLEEVPTALVTIIEHGRPRKVTRRTAMLMKLLQKRTFGERPKRPRL